MTAKNLQGKIKSLFPSANYFSANKKNQTIKFDVDSNSIDFDKLVELSKLLGTKKINFTGSTKDIQIGEMTWDSETSAEINAFEVPKEKFK